MGLHTDRVYRIAAAIYGNFAPDFIMQDAELTTSVKRSHWFLKGIRDMKKDGVTFVRCSIRPDKSHICLLEGWRTKPKDQGEPRFQMTIAL